MYIYTCTFTCARAACHLPSLLVSFCFSLSLSPSRWIMQPCMHTHTHMSPRSPPSFFLSLSPPSDFFRPAARWLCTWNFVFHNLQDYMFMLHAIRSCTS